MKYKSGNYIQLSRSIFSEEYRRLSDSAKWLFVYLSELEHRYTNTEKNWFYVTDAQLAEDLNWSVRKVQRIKQELLHTDLLKIYKTHSKTSTMHISAYEIKE